MIATISAAWERGGERVQFSTVLYTCQASVPALFFGCLFVWLVVVVVVFVCYLIYHISLYSNISNPPTDTGPYAKSLPVQQPLMDVLRCLIMTGEGLRT